MFTGPGDLVRPQRGRDGLTLGWVGIADRHPARESFPAGFSWAGVEAGLHRSCRPQDGASRKTRGARAAAPWNGSRTSSHGAILALSSIASRNEIHSRYVHGLVSDIRIDAEKAVICGSRAAIAAAVTDGELNGTVPTFVRDWRNGQNSNWAVAGKPSAGVRASCETGDKKAPPMRSVGHNRALFTKALR